MSTKETTPNNEKLTNSEVLQQIGELSREEANEYGLTESDQNMALKAAGGDLRAAAAFFAPYTPLYNAFVGFVVKFAISDLSKAHYTDVYARHHRNMTQGRPQLGFVKPAKAGTGNALQQFANSPAVGGLTTVVTAEMPDVVALYDITTHTYVARIPVSAEDVKTAFTTPYGINDLYVKVREGLDDKIIEDRNDTFDLSLTTSAANSIEAGTGTESNVNAGRAVFQRIGSSANFAAAAAANDYSSIAVSELEKVFVTLKRVFYGLVGRPNTRYNALGEKNNCPKDMIVCYIDADLYAELSRVKASLFNSSELEEQGLVLQPLKAPWLGATLSGKTILAAVGSADYIRDYPVSDFGSTVPTDTGVIECRHMSTQVALCGYEPWCYIIDGGAVQIRKLTVTSPSAAIVACLGDSDRDAYATGTSAVEVDSNGPLTIRSASAVTGVSIAWTPVDGQGTAKTQGAIGVSYVSGVGGGRRTTAISPPDWGVYDVVVTGPSE